MTLDELKDYIYQDLTFGGALPNVLPLSEIDRIILQKALPWAYSYDFETLIKTYYYIPRETLELEFATGSKHITLPCDIESVTWIYQLNDSSLFRLGLQSPNLSVNLGVTNTPYLSSYLETIGSLGVYKVIIDSFSDVMNQLNKYTVKYSYNRPSNKLNILTESRTSLILETMTRIPEEYVFNLERFRRYALAECKLQMGRLLTRFDFNLPGEIKINGSEMRTEAEAEITAIKEEIKSTQPNTSFIRMVKR